RVDDPGGRATEARFGICLRGDSRLRVGIVASPAPQPCALRLRAPHAEPDLVPQDRQAALDELDGLDDDRRRVRLVGRLDGRADPVANRGMDYPLQVPNRLVITENDPSKGRAID